ncbi:hypothetical protein LR48_Vigan334s000200 [Vigna angularis]|uniref:Uncharacterized protein n=1 Tax=Phaseolus angularis TaxID=3914 RepID=A0A0L9T8G2_PHAAN|nr:hypothetical protein LR48_Vigan334s000200 [Vigna angularis]
MSPHHLPCHIIIFSNRETLIPNPSRQLPPRRSVANLNAIAPSPDNHLTAVGQHLAATMRHQQHHHDHHESTFSFIAQPFFFLARGNHHVAPPSPDREFATTSQIQTTSLTAVKLLPSRDQTRVLRFHRSRVPHSTTTVLVSATIFNRHLPPWQPTSSSRCWSARPPQNPTIASTSSKLASKTTTTCTQKNQKQNSTTTSFFSTAAEAGARMFSNLQFAAQAET